MVSKNIIVSLLEDLKTFVDDASVLFEPYQELVDDIEPRQDIDRARVALYSGAETAGTKVGAEKPSDSRQNYGIDISVVRGYRGDGGSKGEIPALELKDKVIEWIKQMDTYDVTDGDLHSLGYDSSTPFIRRKRYVTLTMSLSGFRDLRKSQISDP